jgi:hypothetical protein
MRSLNNGRRMKIKLRRSRKRRKKRNSKIRERRIRKQYTAEALEESLPEVDLEDS